MTKRLINIDDLCNFQFAGSPVLSPDGTRSVYVVTETDKENNGYRSSLYLADGKTEPRRLTYSYSKDKLVKDRQPRFSKDGQWLYFLSDRAGKNQVYRLPLSGGEAEVLTNFDEGISQFLLSPDETMLICQSTIKDKKETDNQDVTVVTRLRYLSNGKGFVTASHVLYSFDLKTREQVLLTDKRCHAASPSFSPNGNKLYFSQSKPNADKSDYLNDIYVYDFSTEETSLFYQAKGNVSHLQVSPNGQTIAFAGSEDGECSPENIDIWLISENGGPAKNLTAKEKLSVGNFVGTDVRFDSGNPPFLWENDQSLIYIVEDGRVSGLKRIDLNGQSETIYMKEKEVLTSFDTKNGCIATVLSTPLSPGDLYFLGNNGSSRQVSNHNHALFEELELNEPIPFTYKGAEDWTIDGWILFPPKSARPEGKIPVVLEIHGGPGSAYGDSFNHEFQCLAAEGYAVVFTNPRGSRGYGAEFCGACYDDWGRKDKMDILKGLDYALEHYPELDREKQFVTGGSYGGFMTNTIVGTTNRFTAAVTQRSICNLYSFFGTSDIGYFFLSRHFNQADLWSDEEKIMSFSPIRNAVKVTTPTCIIHSEEDYRCPIEQAEQWYVALRRLGVDTRFVRVKGENHELSRSGRPKNRLTRLHEIINWFNKYLNAPAKDTKETAEV